MLKRFGILSLVLAAGTLFYSPSASAGDWGRQQNYSHNYRDNSRSYRDYNKRSRRDEKNWRKYQKKQQREYLQNNRSQRNRSYDNRYYSPGYYGYGR